MAGLLYIHPGYAPPENDATKSRFYYLSYHHTGDVVHPVWGRRRSGAHPPEAGRFRYHFVYSCNVPKPFRTFYEIFVAVFTGIRLYCSPDHRFDVVISYGWSKTGIAALILKWVTGAKFIIEVPGEPKAALTCHLHPSMWSRIRGALNGRLLRFLIKRADGIHLMYPEQLGGLVPIRDMPMMSFHDLTTVQTVSPTDSDEKYILLIGYPWYLKGVDTLILAFKQIADEFPEHRLRIIGHCPDRSFFEELRGGEQRIEFLAPVRHAEAIEQIANCSVYVLASRTEGMPRVLIEAMALRKPIVASRVGGVPHYLTDGEAGLLFDIGNVDQLAARLRQILSDPELARRLACNAHNVAHQQLSESRYAECYNELLDRVLTASRISKTRTDDAANQICADVGTQN